MAKDYLAMIADIGESDSTSYEKDELRVISPPITPAAILAASRYGSLTRGGLRDALMDAAHRAGMPCSQEDALLCIYASLEAGIIVGPDADGFYHVRQ